MRNKVRLFVPLAVAIGLFAVAATSTSASTGWHAGGVTGLLSPNGIGSLPAAPDSLGLSEGGANLSDGFTPAEGLVEGEFIKGNETYNASQNTTLVDFSLPAGVTVHNDPDLCSGLPGNNCVAWETNCDDSGGVTVSGNEIEFKFVCAPGQGFFFEALLDSVISTDGLYDTSWQFKVGAVKRTKDATNMWQIKNPQSFCVGSACI